MFCLFMEDSGSRRPNGSQSGSGSGTLLRTKRGSIITISKEIRRIQYEQTCGSERALDAKTYFITQNSDRKIATVFIDLFRRFFPENSSLITSC